MITLDDAKILIKLARLSIKTFFSGEIISMPEADKFKQKQGLFVTLKKYDKLRGCIGYPEPVHELNRAVIESARSAAFKDPRFPPLEKDELDEITLEVSVLTKPELIEVEEPLEYLDKIRIGKHGLIVKSQYYSGLLLPQVFTEHDATPKEALEMTCEKAGLYKEAWQDPETKLFSFSAQIFYEEEPQGKIIEKK